MSWFNKFNPLIGLDNDEEPNASEEEGANRVVNVQSDETAFSGQVTYANINIIENNVSETKDDDSSSRVNISHTTEVIGSRSTSVNNVIKMSDNEVEDQDMGGAAALIPVNFSIPNFKGDKEANDKEYVTVEQFISKFNTVRIANNWDDEFAATMGQSFIIGTAGEWITMTQMMPHHREHETFKKWSSMKSELIKRFGIESDTLRHEAMKISLKYTRGENPNKYYDRIMTYIMHKDLNLSDEEKRKDHYWENFWRQAKEKFIEGLPADIKQFMLLWHKNDDLEKMKERLADFVATSFSGNNNPKNPGAPNIKLEPGQHAVNALQKWVDNGHDPKDFKYRGRGGARGIGRGRGRGRGSPSPGQDQGAGAQPLNAKYRNHCWNCWMTDHYRQDCKNEKRDAPADFVWPSMGGAGRSQSRGRARGFRGGPRGGANVGAVGRGYGGQGQFEDQQVDYNQNYNQPMMQQPMMQQPMMMQQYQPPQQQVQYQQQQVQYQQPPNEFELLHNRMDEIQDFQQNWMANNNPNAGN